MTQGSGDKVDAGDSVDRDQLVDRLVDGVVAGNVATLARAVSMVENGRPGFEDLLSRLHHRVGNARRIGITGPPGAGKSTLTERIVQVYRKRDLSVAVVAVDPTSPFSGGALLGDRIRMESVSMDAGVFIRSMATRGAVGGLATTTREVCDLLDAFGFERIIIETVGVGQSELAIAATADTAALILVPEAGDGIQVLKAGVMEIADIYAVNKADRPGADRMAREVQMMIGIRGTGGGHAMPAGHGPAKAALAGPIVPTVAGGEWQIPVLLTSAVKDEGISELVDAVEAHGTHLRNTGELETIRIARTGSHIREVVERAVRQAIWNSGTGTDILQSGVNSVVSGVRSPYDVAAEIVRRVRDEWPEEDQR